MKTTSSFISVILFCCLWITNTRGFMSLDDISKEISPLCYDRRDDQNKELPNGQFAPIPNTLESFISLLEKIENLHPNWNIEEIVKVLLVSFRYDDLEYKPASKVFQSRSDKATVAFNILKQIFGNPSTSGQRLGQNELADDEKCALYFMISHTINSTIREGDETVADSNNKQIIKMPREQGVVMLNSNMKHSFALGKVLLGILAGLKTSKRVNALSIYTALSGPLASKQDILKDMEVSILYAATFGDLISLAAEANENDDFQAPITDIFLPNGWWNEADCPLYYNLATKQDYTILNPQVHTTYASLRGAIDGYVLGEMMQTISVNYRNIRLSQILRAYYNNEELFDGKETATWCVRQAKFDKLKPELQNEAVFYHLLYSAQKGTSITAGSQENIIKSIGSLFDRITASEQEIITDIARDDDTCSTSLSRRCETDTSVFAIMDYKTPEIVQIQQREMFGNLTTGLQMSYYGSTSSIYTNIKPYKGGNELEAIVNFTTYSGCSSCAAKYYKPRQVLTESEQSVFRYLNYTMTLFDEEQEDRAGVPAKVLLYFNFASPNLEDWQLKDAVWAFRRHHRDVHVLAVGKKESLKLFVRDEDKDIITPPPPTNTDFHKNLKERICKVPAIFQYKNCRARTDSDEMSNKYEGFITPNHVQYWAMYPKYFLKSYGIKLTFHAVSGQVRVCFSRYYNAIFDQKEPASDICKETSSTGNSENDVHFYVSNPCHRYTEESCPPFYFYVEGKSTVTSANNRMPCLDPRCKTPDQIQFQFIHQGISCNRGYLLSYSFSIAFYAILGSIFWTFSSTKC